MVSDDASKKEEKTYSLLTTRLWCGPTYQVKWQCGRAPFHQRLSAHTKGNLTRSRRLAGCWRATYHCIRHDEEIELFSNGRNGFQFSLSENLANWIMRCVDDDHLSTWGDCLPVQVDAQQKMLMWDNSPKSFNIYRPIAACRFLDGLFRGLKRNVHRFSAIKGDKR